jgi:hypothetical protein
MPVRHGNTGALVAIEGNPVLTYSTYTTTKYYDLLHVYY